MGKLNHIRAGVGGHPSTASRTRMLRLMACGLAAGLTLAACGSSTSSGGTTSTTSSDTSSTSSDTSTTSDTSTSSSEANAGGSADSSAQMSAPSGSADAGSASGPGGGDANVSGSITVLTNRTDLKQNGELDKYAASFNKLYPKVTVTFQAITDYAGEVKTRMNTENYGDVLLIPPSISRADYPKFFEPLGDAADLSKQYKWTNTATADGSETGPVFGLATFGNANGFVYSKKVWKEAGLSDYPTTQDQLMTDLEAIKSKTKAVPLYTNYKDGWPLQGYSGALGSPTCSTDANAEMATDDAPFSADKGPGLIYTLIFNAAKNKVIEPDPTTTNWENSKTLLATGKIGAMWLGSWAVNQMRDAATKAGSDPADIGMMPWPAQKDGKFCSVTGPDYNQSINIHSKNKAAARAWIDWFTNRSGYAKDAGSIPTAKSSTEMPDTLADFTKAGVTYIELAQNKAGTVTKIDNESEVGFFSSPNSAQKLVDIGRGAAPGTLDSVFKDLNSKWADAVSTVGG